MKKLLHQYLKESTLMQLATVSDGCPWLCNVYFVSDEDNNLYWTSKKARRHSQEILKNPISACTIVYDSKKKQALQITGKSYQVSIEDLERICNLYSEKYGKKSGRLEEMLKDTPDGQAFWILKPDTISFWDEVNFPDSPKQEYL
ncbi:MAG: hypothetical protein ACI9AR_000491 [Flavobacteriaceae bacterium]|jgi:uncharacterized protein YhbP (UPF0306 family)